ncbi:SpoIID/LytB domain-containing protein [bacterium]|nr:SpoIID/LytB domain-containing protein [bacterium]
MKKFAIAIFINILLLSMPAHSAYYGNIPQTTLQIARDTQANSYLHSPHSKLVRVGIGNQNFSAYDYQKASIYGTGEFELYNNDKYIDTYDSENIINISMVGKIFVLTDIENKVIAKVSGPIIFKSDYGFLGIKGLKRGGKDAVYRGEIELVPCIKDGKFHIVNVLPLEEYLKGVVPNEMPVRFGLEALKAQSVAARNYALSPRVKANPNYDVVDSVASQVYFGANTERELSNQAVMETSGIVATYDWSLILAQYSSTAGGYTECYQYTFSDPVTKEFPSKPKPYLVAKPDYDSFEPLNTEEAAAKFYKSKPKSFDVDSTYYRWEREWNGQEIQDAVQANIAAQSATGFVHPAVKKGETIGIIKSLNVLQRGASGKIIKLEIRTDNGNYIVEKELVIRRLFTNKGKALPSANLVFEQEYNKDGDLIYVKAYGGGFGHGVGMSQFGAGYMATTLKMPYEKILQHYYTGITLSTEPFILSSNCEQNKVTQTFFTKDKQAKLVVDNKYKVNYIDAVINNLDEKIQLDTSQRFNKIDISKYLKNGMNTITFYYPLSGESNKGLRMYIEVAGANEYCD